MIKVVSFIDKKGKIQKFWGDGRVREFKLEKQQEVLDVMSFASKESYPAIAGPASNNLKLILISKGPQEFEFLMGGTGFNFIMVDLDNKTRFGCTEVVLVNSSIEVLESGFVEHYLEFKVGSVDVGESQTHIEEAYPEKFPNEEINKHVLGKKKPQREIKVLKLAEDKEAGWVAETVLDPNKLKDAFGKLKVEVKKKKKRKKRKKPKPEGKPIDFSIGKRRFK